MKIFALLYDYENCAFARPLSARILCEKLQVVRGSHADDIQHPENECNGGDQLQNACDDVPSQNTGYSPENPAGKRNDCQDQIYDPGQPCVQIAFAALCHFNILLKLNLTACRNCGIDFYFLFYKVKQKIKWYHFIRNENKIFDRP